MKNPEIRFINDNIDWQNKKIEDILEPYAEKNINNYPSVAIGRYGIRKREEIYSKELTKDTTKNKVINKNTLTVGMGSTQIDIGILHTDEHFSVSPAYHTFNILDNDSKFIESSFAKNNEKYSKQHMIIGARQGKSVDFPNFLADTIYLPPMKVQQEIASLLTNIEDKITKQENLIQKLKDTKSSLLLKMFPQENQSAPELRFDGFTDTWEQRKLSDLVKKITRKNTNNESDLPLTISSQYGLIDQNTFFNKRIASRDVSNYYLLFNGEFAYNKSSSDGYPFGSVKRLDLYDKGVLSTLYIVFDIKNKEEIDSDFLAIFFETDRWYKGVSERATEGARNHGLLNISAEDFLDIDLFVPKSIQEQKEIASYFYNLNKTITLHQRKPFHLNFSL